VTRIDRKLDMHHESMIEAARVKKDEDKRTTRRVAKSWDTVDEETEIVYDVFVSHCKRLVESEDRAVWVADVVEVHGLRPFFDRCDLLEITASALEQAVLASRLLVTVLDPFTFISPWVLMENLSAANCGIPIIMTYDADRFHWAQLDKWVDLYPWAFQRPAVAVTKKHRSASVEELLKAVRAALEEERQPPETAIDAQVEAHAPVKVGVGSSRVTDSSAACDIAHRSLVSRLGGTPSLIVAAATCTHDIPAVMAKLHELAPSVPMLGCTTCRGVVLNGSWLTSDVKNEAFSLGLWGIRDTAGAFAVRHLAKKDSTRLRDSVFDEVLHACLSRPDEPAFALLFSSPGQEEAILDGMQAALGDVPILGGSSADNAGLGEWRQFAKAGVSHDTVAEPSVSEDGITFVIAWASCSVTSTLTSGFRPTPHRGVVTAVDADRTIVAIDGKSASAVYETWSDGAVMTDVEWEGDTATVLRSSAFMPLGELCQGEIAKVMHPAFIHKHGAVTTFADAREGMEIGMLTAAPETLAKNISQSARSLLAQDLQSAEDCIGALMIFCGGLVMAIDTLMPLAAEQLSTVVGHNSVMGVCCFGEQGMSKGTAVHGNLMFGCLLFSSRPRGDQGLQSYVVSDML